MKIPKILTNIWVISTILVLIFFLIIPYLFVHPKQVMESQTLNQVKLNLPSGDYVYKISFEQHFIDKMKNDYEKAIAQGYEIPNMTNANNNSNDGNVSNIIDSTNTNKTSNVNIKNITIQKKTWINFEVTQNYSGYKKPNYVISTNISGESPILLDAYGNEIGSNSSLMITKPEYNLIITPWMSAINGTNWIWKTGKKLDILGDKINLNENIVKTIGETVFKNRSAYIVLLSDGKNNVTYTVDKQYKIALYVKTDNYYSELMSAPFLK